MENNWVQYQCKADQSFFLHNKVTGEFRWPHQSRQGVEYKIMHGRPVTYKEFSTIATQTDDNGCNNGCMSMYISTDQSHVSNISDATLHQQTLENVLISVPHVANASEHKNEPSQFSETLKNNQNILVENSSDNDDNDDNDSNHSENTIRDAEHKQAFHQESTNNTVQTSRCNNPHCQGDGCDYNCVRCSSKSVHIAENSNVNSHDYNAAHVAGSSDIYDHGVIVSVGYNDASAVPLIVNSQEIQSIRYNNTNEPANNGGSTFPKRSPHTSKNKTKQQNECPVCKKVFSTAFYLKQHVVMHTGEKNFECKYCKKKYAHYTTLKSHLRLHADTVLECSYCKKKFDRKDKLQQHVRTHTDERPFECSYCNKTFHRKDTLNGHACIEFKIALNGGECSHCKKKLTTKSEIVEHVKMHNAELEFECSVCKKRFSKKHYLNIHLNSHNKEKLLECRICKKTFSVRGQLNRHVKIHFKVKPFECSFCDMKFCSRTVLTRHTTIHTGEKPYECKFCDKKFARTEYLKRHLKKHEDF